MKSNRLKEIWREGGIVWNGWLHIPNTWSAEIMAHAGWESLTIDLQHGLHGVETAIQMMQAISTTDTVPLARLTWNDPGMAMRLLDGGAYGIICPMIETRADCEAFVGACRYPPLGYRSLGPTRARVYAGADYALYANDEIVTFAMVETQRALDNLDEIASVPGLDGIFVGPGDLYLSLTGKIGMDVDDPVMDAALDAVIAACQARNLVPGIFTGSAAYARRMALRGFRFITLKTDTLLLTEAAKTIVTQAKSSEKEE
jgi:4-hydroxy-2-oxoheptanedioate aldolase